MQELLKRYTQEQQQVISDYWEVIRWTRQTGRISEGIKKTELAYWSQFPLEVVIRALEIHMDSAPNIKEHYTRGIMRNLEMEQSAEKVKASRSKSRRPQSQGKKNRFANYRERETDFEAIEELELMRETGELTAEKIEELKQNPRYRGYL